jgi:hypothetical protein
MAPLIVDLSRLDYDLHVDLGFYEVQKSGGSVRACGVHACCDCGCHVVLESCLMICLVYVQLGLAAACSLVQLLTGVGVEKWVALTGVVCPSGLVTEVGGYEGKLRMAAEADHIEVLVLPRADHAGAQAIVARQGWSGRVRLIPVSDMEEVIRVVFLQSVRDYAEPPGKQGTVLLVPLGRGKVLIRSVIFRAQRFCLRHECCNLTLGGWWLRRPW